MVIELRGVEFVNKGAELMLHAIIAKVRDEIPHAVFVMEKNSRVPAIKLKENRIFQKLNFNKFRVNLGKLGTFIPKRIRRKSGFILPCEINVILDASGFAFGDTWGARKAGYRLADHIVNWKKQGKKVIMLPQAFGPFTEEALIAKMKIIISNADLICARDQISYEYIRQLTSDNSNVILRPDFTNLVKGAVPPYFDNSTCEVAIIPNSKMIETLSRKDGKAYMHLLERLIVMIREFKHKPFFLIHEGQSDSTIAEKINQHLTNKLPVIKEDNPLFVKGIIGASKAVITSRFHGLVSCLSQAIPCLTTGWSHKYEMLLEDYNYPEALLDVHSDDKILQEKVELILTEPSSFLISKNLKKEGVRQKQLSEEMWKEVFEKMI